MTKSLCYSLLVSVCMLSTLFLQDAHAQVSSAVGKTRSDSYRLYKDVPIRKNSGLAIQGNGQPTSLYVVQLARFEDMDYFPSTFPKGTFLWGSQDHQNEKILYAGFYQSSEDAHTAAAQWKKNPMFKGAFAVALPFAVRYE